MIIFIIIIFSIFIIIYLFIFSYIHRQFAPGFKKTTLTTRYDYEMGILKKNLSGVAISVGFTLFSFYRKRARGGMIFQMFYSPYILFKQNLFKAYVLKQDLPRPFPSSGMMEQLNNAFEEFDNEKKPGKVRDEQNRLKTLKKERKDKIEKDKIKLDKINPHMSAEARAIHLAKMNPSANKPKGTMRRKK